MPMIKKYMPDMQNDIEVLFAKCVTALGWDFEPDGRHADIMNIRGEYVDKGAFWCLYENGVLAGIVAIRRIDDDGAVAEMKRLYILPEFQGKGFGGLLFVTALDFVKESGFRIIRLDTREDRASARHLIDKYRFRRIEQYNQNAFAELFYELDLNDYSKDEYVNA